VNTDAIRRFIQIEILDDEDAAIEYDDDLLLNQVLDSLGVMRLVAHIEEVEGMMIPAEDVTIENFSSLRLIDAYLLSRCNSAQPAVSPGGKSV
jgi:acyl carrier protein